MSNTGTAYLHEWLVGTVISGYTKSLTMSIPSDTEGSSVVGEIGSGECLLHKWKTKNIPVISGSGTADFAWNSVEGTGAGTGSFEIELDASGSGLAGIIGSGETEFTISDVAAFGGGHGEVEIISTNSSGDGRVSITGSGFAAIKLDVEGQGHLDNIGSGIVEFRYNAQGQAIAGVVGNGEIAIQVDASGVSNSVSGTGEVVFNFYLTSSGLQDVFGSGDVIFWDWIIRTRAKIDSTNDWMTLEYRRREFYE